MIQEREERKKVNTGKSRDRTSDWLCSRHPASGGQKELEAGALRIEEIGKSM